MSMNELVDLAIFLARDSGASTDMVVDVLRLNKATDTVIMTVLQQARFMLASGAA